MIEARRKDNETTGAFLRRFTRKVQRSGVLIRSRRIKFKKKPKTKVERRSATLTRQKDAREQERLFKLGKIGKFGE
ncbi:MAG: 30S ribosomal protein S21 [Patescibacteria group bacterium]